jgi:hypothetical protein
VFIGMTSKEEMPCVPGRHVNDHQMRLFMRHRQNDPVILAAAKAGFSPATGYRIEQGFALSGSILDSGSTPAARAYHEPR